MADISQEIQAFQEAVYGEEVRGSMVSLAEKLNDVSEDTEDRVDNFTANINTAINNANTAASNANSKAIAADTAANAANAAATNANGKATNASNAATSANQAATAANQAANNATQAEANRAAAETARQNAESTRQANEQSRQTAESARVTAENARANSESSRASAEAVRQNNESTRQGNESVRTSAENVRASNEERRQLTFNRLVAEFPSLTDEQVDAAVTSWLDAHPEATTTVQDGSITDAKLVQSGGVLSEVEDIREQVGDIHDYEDMFLGLTHGINYIDSSKLTVGFLSSDGSLLTNGSYANYKTSDFIALAADKNYIFSMYRIDGSAYNTSNFRIVYLLYDTSKSPISASYYNVDTYTQATIATTQNCYVRICTAANVQFQLTEGTTPETRYHPFVEYKSLLSDVAVRNNDDVVTWHAGKNVLDESQSLQGKLLQDQFGHIEDYEPYDTSDFIPIKANQSIVFSPSIRKFLAYDAEKISIPASYAAPSNLGYAYTATVDGYVRVSYQKQNRGTEQAEYAAVATSFEPYKEIVDDSVHLGQAMVSDVQGMIGNPQSILTGKKWVPLGDSFTEYTNATYDSGIYSGKNKTYPYIIALRNYMNLVQTFFQSGRTLAYPSDGTFANSICNPNAAWYYQNIPADTDYITIYLGINDSHHETGEGGDGEDPTGIIPLGTLADSTTATYYGAWNVVLAWLLENRPFAHIGIIVSNGVDRMAYRTAQLEIAEKYGIPYIDLNGDARTPAMLRAQNNDIPAAIKTIRVQTQSVDYDGTITGSVNQHPNYKAHEFESTFIEGFLRAI